MENVVNRSYGIATGTPTFADPEKIWSIRFRRNRAQYTERSKDTKGGIVWTQNLTAEVARGRLSVEQLIQRVGNRRVGVMYIDRNGLIRYLYDMRMGSNYETGKRLSDINGYELRWTKETSKESDYIAGAIDVDIIIGDPPPGGGSSGNTAKYVRFENFTSAGTVTLPFTIPTNVDTLNQNLLVFRNGVKIALNHPEGYTQLTNSQIQSDEPFEDETLEIIYKP